MKDIRHASEDTGGALPAGRQGSIRNISIGRRAARHQAEIEEEHVHHLPPEPPHHRPRRRARRFWLIGGGVVVLCALAGVLLSTVFAGATLTIYPKKQVVDLPATLQAQQNAPVGVLQYQTISVTRSASQTVAAQGTARVSRAASGLITISNSYSSAPQRLIANTRFEAQDGKIYRIRDSVIVPGSSGSTAGTVTATVYADSPGPDYNKSSATFTIPGFKGDPRYSKFAATTQGAISGGFVGDEPSVAPADLAVAKTALQKQVDADVRAAAASQIPVGSVAIPGTLGVVFADMVQTASADKTATLTQSATATGGIVRQADLAAAIARKAVVGYKGEAVLFGDVSKTALTVATSTKLSDGALTLLLSGQTELVWQFDPNALIAALVGKDKSEFQTVIQGFEPAIAKADASIRPFWQGKFPNDPEKILVKTATN